MDYEEIIKTLKEKRKEHHLTQKELALRVGVGKTYISKIENGSERASEELIAAIQECLEKYEPLNPIEILFDYVRIRFPTTVAGDVIKNVLHLRMEYFLHEDYAFYGYSEQYVLGDIIVMASPDEKKGILLELKGRGCRQFERYLKAQKRTWFDFLMRVKGDKGILKRVDLAINDCIGILDIPMMTEKTRKKECITLFRSFKSYESGEFTTFRDQYKSEMGNTLYLGSLKSEIYFCIYEKDYEQYVKAGVSMEESKVKNRFEIRLKNERAERAVEDLLKTRDAGKTVFAIINRYICFIDPKKGKEKGERKINPVWKSFIRYEERKIRLTTKPEPYSIEKTYKWLNKQVMPSLKMAEELDKARGTCIIQDMRDRTELKENHKKIIAQQSIPAKELVF